MHLYLLTYISKNSTRLVGNNLYSPVLCKKKKKIFLNDSDGVVLNTTPIFEEPAIAAFKSWFVDKPVTSAGPFDYQIVKREKDSSPEAQEVHSSLDSALKSHGPHSVRPIN